MDEGSLSLPSSDRSSPRDSAWRPVSSCPDPERNFRHAFLMGAATSVTIVVPGVPWIFSSGTVAVVRSCFIALVVAGLITHARPGGWSTWLQTYGVLVGVGAIAAIAGQLS